MTVAQVNTTPQTLINHSIIGKSSLHIGFRWNELELFGHNLDACHSAIRSGVEQGTFVEHHGGLWEGTTLHLANQELLENLIQVAVRNSESGTLVAFQNLNADSTQAYQDQVARDLMDAHGLDYRDHYVVISDQDGVKNKFEISAF